MSRPFGLNQAHPFVGASANRPTMGANAFEQGGRGLTNVNQPPPPPRPQKQENQYVRAIADYIAMEDNELTFMKGEILTLLKKDPSGWWYGDHKSKQGWFSPDFVEILPSGYTPPTMQNVQSDVSASPMSPPKRQTRTLDKEALNATLKSLGNQNAAPSPISAPHLPSDSSSSRQVETEKPNVYTPPVGASMHKFDKKIASPFLQTDRNAQPSVVGIKPNDPSPSSETPAVVVVSPVSIPAASNHGGFTEKPSSTFGPMKQPIRQGIVSPTGRQQPSSSSLVSPRLPTSSSSKTRQPPSRKAPPPPAMTFEGRQYAQVWYNFLGTSSEELSVNEGDIAEVITREGEWCEISHLGKSGWVPATYIKLIPNNKPSPLGPESPDSRNRNDPPQRPAPLEPQPQQKTTFQTPRDAKPTTAPNQPALPSYQKLQPNRAANVVSPIQARQNVVSPPVKPNPANENPTKANTPNAPNLKDSTQVSLDAIERKGAPLLPPSRPQAAGKRAPTRAMRPIHELVNMMDIPIPEEDPTPPTTSSSDRSMPSSAPKAVGPRVPGGGPNMGELQAALAKRQGSGNVGPAASPALPEPNQQKVLGGQTAVSPRGLAPKPVNVPGPQGPGVPPRPVGPSVGAFAARDNTVTSTSIPNAPSRPAPIPTQLQGAVGDARARFAQKQVLYSNYVTVDFRLWKCGTPLLL
eukprot:TRINITY_DN7338_c0_g2_i4.p1 TRINITY_DN7338_c0_g2~~TRINITY_DN7338_c0_g2_i4.p1  ORF type:complete len:691 (-),score=99.69 TRINITY_DN7338_c0_g2_i4:833-2905(-)